MKQNSVYLRILLLVFLLLNVYLLVNNVRLRIMGSLNERAETSSYSLRMSHLTNLVNNSYENCGLGLGNTSLMDVSKIEQISISALLDSMRNTNKDVALICRFKQRDCEKCVIYALERASVFTKQNDISLLIWGKYDEIIQLKSFRNRFDSPGNSIWYNVSELPIPIDRNDRPFYMVLTKEGFILDLFSPERMDPKQTDIYFNMLDLKWRNNQSVWY